MYQSLSTVIEITERQSSNGVFQIISTVRRCSKSHPTRRPSHSIQSTFPTYFCFLELLLIIESTLTHSREAGYQLHLHSFPIVSIVTFFPFCSLFFFLQIINFSRYLR